MGQIWVEYEKCGSTFKVLCLFSNYPRFGGTYLVRVPFLSDIAVFFSKS